MKHLILYGVVVGLVIVIGAIAIWSFVERQSLVIQPEPLPRITVVTRDPNSRLAAAWVQLLTRAELNPTLVPLETFNPIEGVVVFCDIPEIPSRLAAALDEFVRRGGALAFVGKPPATPIGRFQIFADEGTSDSAIRLGENASPVLARLAPGSIIESRATEVAFLKETPRMMIDARWADNARAAIMHIEIDRGRYLWFGFDPDAISSDSAIVEVVLRSAFRWVGGQPVSDGAVGTPNLAKTLAPEARRDARENRFSFTVDRARDPDYFTVKFANEGGVVLLNPTVKVWLPPRVTSVELDGDILMTRNATLTGVPEEGACLVSLPNLTRNEERIMKLRIVERKSVSVAVSR